MIPWQQAYRCKASKELRGSRCKRVVLFLDSCESGILDIPSRTIISHLTPTELEDFFNSAEFCVCFASSETSQSSYSASSLKHGIWTYHVIEALKGEAPDILEQGRYLTATVLQDYLMRAVPRTIAKSFSTPIHQTPILRNPDKRYFPDSRFTRSAGSSI